MEGSKLKNIAIVILVLVNLFLLVLSGGRRMQDARAREEAVNSAVQVIRTGGVQLDEQTVPAEMDLRPLVVRRDLEAERLQARTFLGGDVSVEARGSEVYRYSNAAGWLQMHSTGQYSAQLIADRALSEQERPEDHAVALLGRLEMESRVVGSHVANGQGEVVLVQLLNGVELLDCQTVVRYEDSRVVELSGSRSVPGQACQVEGTPITVATALMRLYNGLNDMGDIYSAIQSIAPAYTLTPEGGGAVRLTPVWKVTTDTGVYRLNTLNGVLTRGDHTRQTPQEPDVQ